MRSKVLIISTVIFAISVSSCSDRSTEESINNVTSAIGTKSTNFNTNREKVEDKSKTQPNHMNQNLTLKQSKSKSWLTRIKLFDRANIKSQ